MADATYDAVVVGGGTKSLVTAMYLAKYAGMSVGIFEKRKEIGGSMKTREGAAPGFYCDFCGTEMLVEYFLPIYRDFPDYEEKGLDLYRFDACHCLVHLDSRSVIPIYDSEVDPSGERTAKEIARFAGEKDAETFQKIDDLWHHGGLREAKLKQAFGLLEHPKEPEKQPLLMFLKDYMKRPDAIIDEEFMNLPLKQAVNSLWESELMRYFFQTRGPMPGDEFGDMPLPKDMSPPEDMPTPMFLMPGMNSMILTRYNRTHRSTKGGTHSLAHFYIRNLLEYGAEFFANSPVQNIIIENGTAKGIRLADGTEIEAKQLVLGAQSHVDLAVLVGKDHLSEKAYKKTLRILDTFIGVQENWYTWALHEPPDWWAAEINPVINNAKDIRLGEMPDCAAISQRNGVLFSGKEPEESMIRIMNHSFNDPSRAAPGKFTMMTGEFCLGPRLRTVREWMEYKKSHAEKVIKVFQKFAPNMTWDNVIGYDPATPWDHKDFCLRGAPGITGVWGSEPIPGFFNYRTPIKNLYGTGDAWAPNILGMLEGGVGPEEGYVCYKAIAKDLGLTGQPWEGEEW